nr:hypothetical protein [Tanacetum cinerariifolium]
MVAITRLPVEILTMIMVIVASSANGARDLAWISATCKEFKKVAKEMSVLKLLNFQDSTSTCTLDYRKHRHPKDILFLCARYGNQIAESCFGKGLLDGDNWCWLMIFLNSNPIHDEFGSIICGPLWHPRLVKSFIRHGSHQHLSRIFFPLRRYMISNSILKEIDPYGSPLELLDMCVYEQTRSDIIAYNTQLAKRTGRAIEEVMLESDKRPPSLVPRERRLRIVGFNLEGAMNEWFKWITRNGLITTGLGLRKVCGIVLDHRRASGSSRDIGKTTGTAFQAQFGALREELQVTRARVEDQSAPAAVTTAEPVTNVRIQRLTTPCLGGSSTAVKTPNPPLLPTPNTYSKPLAIKWISPTECHKRLNRGLCFNYDNKWVRGHKCSGNFLLLMENDEDDAIQESEKDVIESGDIYILNSLIGQGSPRSL